jgi:hypothetical protein
MIRMSSKANPRLASRRFSHASIWPSPAPSCPKTQPAGKTPGARYQATPNASRLAICGGQRPAFWDTRFGRRAASRRAAFLWWMGGAFS